MTDSPLLTASSPDSPLLTASSPDSSRILMGGKAANLHRMSRLGLPVPRWFCLGTDVFEAAFATAAARCDAVLAAIDFGCLDQVERGSRELSGILLTLEVPGRVSVALEAAAAVLGTATVAVRSSGEEEDAQRDSFAGQLDSFLNITPQQVAAHVVRCWASVASRRHLLYRHQRGYPARVPAVAVIVQAMAPSRASGVMFTANPQGRLDELVVEAGYGLGEGIVSGRVATDTAVFDRSSRSWRVAVGEKRERVVPAPEVGTRLEPVEAPARSRAVLDEPTLQTLRRLGDQLVGALGHDQDVEWCVDPQGGVHLLQSRPITTIPRGEVSVLDNSNIVESYPAVTLPLTYSFVRHLYEVLFRRAILHLGAPPAEVEAHDDVFQTLLGYVKGRVYYNLTQWVRMIGMVPGSGSYLPVWAEMLGIRHPPAPPSGPLLRRAARWARWVWARGRLGWWFIGLEPQMRRFHKRFAQTRTRFWSDDLDTLDAQALASRYRRLVANLAPIWDVSVLNDPIAFLLTAWARRQLDRLGISEADATSMLAVGDSLGSLEPVESALQLAALVRGDADLRRVVESVTADPEVDCLAALATDPRCETFLQLLQDHLDRLGDRGLEELKLECPSFRDDPRTFLQLVVGYARVEPDTLSRGGLVPVDSVRAWIRSQVWTRPFTVASSYALLALARRSIGHRESARLERARAFSIVRALFSALGDRLHEAGVLDDPVDVFWLTVEEVLAFTRGCAVDTDLAGLAGRRREEFRGHRDLELPERLVCRGPVGAFEVARRPPAEPAGTTELRGTGCSQGTVRARALVVIDPRHPGDVAGRILVARMTDPGWVFLMVPAAGLVVEKGSLLSHTAIVGRELGIPTVVGVCDATRLISTGQELEIDGGAGTVRLCDPGDSGTRRCA